MHFVPDLLTGLREAGFLDPRFWSVTHAQSADECPLLGANRTFDRAAAYQSRFMSTRPSSRMSASRLILNKVHLRQSEPGFAPVARIEPNPSWEAVS